MSRLVWLPFIRIVIHGMLGACYLLQNKNTRKYLHMFVWLHLCENVKPEAEAVHAKHIFFREVNETFMYYTRTLENTVLYVCGCTLYTI